MAEDTEDKNDLTTRILRLSVAAALITTGAITLFTDTWDQRYSTNAAENRHSKTYQGTPLSYLRR